MTLRATAPAQAGVLGPVDRGHAAPGDPAPAPGSAAPTRRPTRGSRAVVSTAGA